MNFTRTNWILIYLLVFLVKVGVAFMPAHYSDMQIYIGWSKIAFNEGVSEFYAGNVWTDYLPGTIYLLTLLYWIYTILTPLWPEVSVDFLFKLLPVIADMATVWIVYATIKRILIKHAASTEAASGIGFVGALMYLLAPFTTINAALWGQMDALFTLFLALTFYFFVKERLFWSVMCLACSIIVKPHGLFLVLPLGAYLLLQKKYFLMASLSVHALMVLLLLSFPAYGFDFLSGIYRTISNNLDAYEYNSLNIYNFWGIFGFFLNSTVTIFAGLNINMIGYILTASAYTLGLWSIYSIRGLLAGKHRFILMAYYLGYFIFASVMFLPKMHERYYYPMFIFMFVHVYTLEILRIGAPHHRVRKLLTGFYVMLFALVILHSVNLLFVYDIMMYTPVPNGLFRLVESTAPLFSALTYGLFLYYALVSEYTHRKYFVL